VNVRKGAGAIFTNNLGNADVQQELPPAWVISFSNKCLALKIIFN